jgi:hypothetical protein
VNVKRWRELYTRLIAEGRMRDVPAERISDVVGNVIYGTMFTNYFAGQTKPAADQARDILDIIFHGVLTDAERARRLADDVIQRVWNEASRVASSASPSSSAPAESTANHD